MTVHIDIDIQDEQEVNRVLSLLIREQVSHQVRAKTTPSDEQRASAHERLMRGGSQRLGVDEMVAYVKETRDRKLPFRDDL